MGTDRRLRAFADELAAALGSGWSVLAAPLTSQVLLIRRTDVGGGGLLLAARQTIGKSAYRELTVFGLAPGGYPRTVRNPRGVGGLQIGISTQRNVVGAAEDIRRRFMTDYELAYAESTVADRAREEDWNRRAAMMKRLEEAFPGAVRSGQVLRFDGGEAVARGGRIEMTLRNLDEDTALMVGQVLSSRRGEGL